MASDRDIVLRPAAAQPVERYSALRIAEFDAAKRELADYSVTRDTAIGLDSRLRGNDIT